MASRRWVPVAAVLLLVASVAVPALADYLGPNRTVTTWAWRRLHCHYEAVYDPPGSGWYGCTLDLYDTPDSSCPSGSSVADYFTSASCGWAQAYCQVYGCSIGRSGSVESCSEGDSGCRAVAQTVAQPPATVAGSVSCGVPGNDGWCRGGAGLSLSGSEPLAGYEITAIEGTRNGEVFACPGASCSIGLLEGGNDFTFWALSSWGDSSLMGSASGRLDSGPPTISGALTGTAGEAGWYVSDVIVEASAGDGVSGVVSLEVAIDGGGWAAYGGPVTLIDGNHTMDLRAVDAAGNLSTQSQAVRVDTQPPAVALTADPSFCPGCAETLLIALDAQDLLSGVMNWALTADGLAIGSATGPASETLSWDGGGLAAGAYTLRLQAWDEAGNASEAGLPVTLVAPTPRPPPPRRQPTATPLPPAVIAPSSTASPSVMPAETRPGGGAGNATEARAAGGQPTGTAMAFVFGGAPAAPPLEESESGPTGPEPAARGGSLNVVWGAGAAALIASATAIALSAARRRREAEARERAEMERRNAAAEAREEAERQRLAVVAAQQEAGRQQLAAATAATAAAAAAAEARRREAERRRLERKEATLEPQMPPVERAPAVVAVATSRNLGAVAEARDGIGQVPARAAQRPWWQRAVDWVDQHQTAISIGLGVVAAGVAIALTGGAALPVVAAVVGSGVVAAAGTAGLNAYFGRPLSQGVVQNAGLALLAGGITASAVALVGMALGSGVVQTGLYAAGNAAATFCVSHPTACQRADAVLVALDRAEEVGLAVTAAVRTWQGDFAGAGEALVELQFEQMDGGIPGDTVVRRLDAALDRFTSVDAAGTARVLDTVGDAVSEAGEIPLSLSARRITTIGHGGDMEAAAELGGFRTFTGTWTLERNLVWLEEAVANGDVFYLASPVVEDTLRGPPQFGGVSVFMRELDALVEAGYRRVGPYLVPPH